MRGGNSSSQEALWVEGSVNTAAAAAEGAASEIRSEAEVNIGFSIQVPSKDGQPREGGDHFGSGEVESIYKSRGGVS